MRIKLGTLAEIKTGYTFRDRIEDQDNGNLRVLQIRDIRDESIIKTDALPRVFWEGKGEPPLLKTGDVVLSARGDHQYAACFEGGHPVVPSSQLFVLQLCRHDVLPHYLCWFLNHPDDQARKHIETSLSGSGMPALTKQAAMELTVPVPSLEVQQQILSIQRLADEEARCLEQLKLNRTQMLKAIFKELLEQKP